MEKQKNGIDFMAGMILPVTVTELKEMIAEAVNNGIGGNTNSIVDTTDEFLDVKQTSKFLQLAIPTIYSLTYKKKIPFYRPGKKLLFRRAELEKWRLGGRQEQSVMDGS